ncbi:hypothetical protein LCGC14_3104830, partial [marine sediment metagenome]
LMAWRRIADHMSMGPCDDIAGLDEAQ